MSNSISNNSLPNIIRSGDFTYEYETAKLACWQKSGLSETNHLLKTKVRIELPIKSYKNLPDMKKLTQQIIKCAENTKSCLESTIFKDLNTGRRWKVVKRSSALRKLGRFLERKNFSKFVHTVDSPAVETYELKRVWTLWDFFLEIYLFFAHKYEEPEYHIPYDSRDASKDAGLNDPFTQLASRAYQDLEHDFICHDEGSKAGEFTSDYIMIYKNGNLQLIRKEEKKKYKKEAKEALRLCWGHYKREYGKEKMDYAQYLANFNYQKMMKSYDGDKFEGITPEHIYRMNILTSSVEHQDVQAIASKLQRLVQQLEEADGEKSLQKVFDELVAKKSTIWANREIRSLMRSVAEFNAKEAGDTTVDDLRAYCKRWNLSWNLHSKLQYTRSVILSVGSRRYETLEELIDKHPDLQGIWNTEEKEDLIRFVRAFTQTRNSKSDDFLKAHQYLQHYVNIALSTKGDELSQELKPWLTSQMNGFVDDKKQNVEAAESLCRLIKKDTVKITDFVQSFEDTSSRLTTVEYDTLAHIYLRDKEELERAYTGRKILKTLNSPYTQADKNYYKPWVDMQEFLQSCDELKTDAIKDPYTGDLRVLSAKEKQRRFDEIAAFFLSKKHLFRPHPREGYRVGELIPGPTDDEGNRRWYRLSRMIASHDGLMNYVLEPLGENSGLETCVVSRSTAGDHYAYESEATLKNDANPIKDPGYLGRRHIDKYLDPVRKRHTIPAWVAYQHAARIDLGEGSSDKAYQNLLRATSELHKDVQIKYHKKSLHEIVGEFDAEINDLMGKRLGFRRWFNSLWFLKYTPLIIIQLIFRAFTRDLDALMKVVIREAHKRSQQKISGETTKQRRNREVQERKDSLKLLRYIKDHAPRDYKGKLDSNYQELINALGDHIYRNNRGEVDEYFVDQLKQSGYDLKRGGWYKEYNDAEAAIADILNQSNQYAAQYVKNSSQETLSEWEKFLHRHAESLGENVEVKSVNGLRYAGHSLGGSTAEVETYLTTAGSNRMPIPGTTIHASLYDDAGMAEEDNLTQYQFMLDHLDLMEKMDVKLSVYHSHDYGDIVPLGGTAHLGGITPEVNKQIKVYIAKHKIQESPEYRHWLEKKGITTRKDQEKYTVQYMMERLHDTFYTVTELKKATSYALEAEIGDYPVKHGTRYESARREQTMILEIANAVASKKLDVDLNKNLGVLCNFMMNIYSSDDEAFKKQFPDVYTEPLKCIQEFDPENAERFLSIEHKLSIGGRLTPEEFKEHDRLKKRGLKTVYEHARRLQKQRQIYKSIQVFSDREADKIISDICNLLIDYGKTRSATAKQILLSGYGQHLQIIREIYHSQMVYEADIVRARAVGGMSVTWLDRTQLGEISGRGLEDDAKVSERYGLGRFCTPESIKKLRKHVGEYLFPAFKSHSYDENARNRLIRKKGHAVSIFHRNKKSKALVIDELGGPIVGMH